MIGVALVEAISLRALSQIQSVERCNPPHVGLHGSRALSVLTSLSILTSGNMLHNLLLLLDLLFQTVQQIPKRNTSKG